MIRGSEEHQEEGSFEHYRQWRDMTDQQYYQNSKVFNVDCMDGMRMYPDGFFDLAIVDPEYRDDNQPTQDMRKNGGMGKWYGKPKPEYFQELFRVSKNQIIWGGNYFTSNLEENNNWIVWYKNNAGTGFSMCELAWSSIKKNIQLFEHRPMGQKSKIHPTQKPIELYKWLLHEYGTCKTCKNQGSYSEDVVGDGGSRMDMVCDECDIHENGPPKILDTHLGSGSSRIAADSMGFDFTGFELNSDYFDASAKRFAEYKSQLTLI